MTVNRPKTESNIPKYARFVLLLLIAVLLIPATYALTIFTSYIHKGTELSGGIYDSGATGSSALIDLEVTQNVLTFNAAGDSQDVELVLKNSSDAHISYYYDVTTSASAEQTSAILVYYDGEFIDTLSHLTQAGRGVIESDNFILAGNTVGDSHTLSFRLHISAPDEYLNTAVPVTVTAYTKNLNYRKYILVSDRTSFNTAVNDINSGMMEADPVIILTSPVTLDTSYTITVPATLNLYGNELAFSGGANLTFSQEGLFTVTSSKPLNVSSLSSAAGSIVLDGESSLLNIEDFTGASLYSGLVSAVSYDTSGAAALIKTRFNYNIGKGINGSESKDVLGALGFYPLVTAAGAGYTYNSGVITAAATDITKTEYITINGENVYFRILGRDNAAVYASLLENELAHLEKYNAVGNTDIVISDLFLPVSVKDKNVTINWRSSDETMIASDGKFADTVKDNQEVTLFAEIRVNESLFCHSFTFRISSMNNETKFANLVADIHPILTNVYKEGYGTDARYFLPVVDASSANDYRTDYTAHTSHPKSGIAPTVTSWVAHADIGLVSMTYTPNSLFTYITVENGNELYLNVPTFSTFAQATVTASFANDDKVYEETVNVTIELGEDNDELYDLVFAEINSQLDRINVLQNILDTRIACGMGNERGDFYLTDNYMTFSVEYSIPSASAGALRATDGSAGFLHDTANNRYHIGINTAGFYAQETQIGINVKITPPNLENHYAERMLYVTVPAIIRPSSAGIANIGVLNSVKYQLFGKLPANERTDTGVDTTELFSRLPAITSAYNSGFSVSGSTLTNNTGAYILKYDADRMTDLSLSFIVGETASSVNTVENSIWKLSRLLHWATGNVKVSDPVNGTYQSDGKAYLNDDEVAAIKSFYMTTTGISEAGWNTLWENISDRAPGYVIIDDSTLNETIKTFGFSTSDYFKYLELLQWTTDQINWDEGSWRCPNMGVVGIFDIKMNNIGTETAATSIIVDNNSIDYWTAVDTTPASSKIHTLRVNGALFYIDDNTEYISDAEAQILLTFFFNIGASDSDTTLSSARLNRGKTFARAFFNCTTIPTNLLEGAADKLISSMYTALSATPVGYRSTLQNGIPLVSNLDGVQMTNLPALTALTVKGVYTVSGSSWSAGQPAFIQTSSLVTFFNRITNQGAQKLTSLTMQNCAAGNTVFDISNAARLKNLTHFDISYNYGVKSVGTLVDLSMSKLTYLDIYGVDVEQKFLDYPLSNLRSNAPTAGLWYDSNGNTAGGTRTNYAANATVAEVLTYLNEIGDIRSNYLQLCQQLIGSGGAANSIIWRIEEGNPMYIVSNPGIPSVTLAEAESMAKNFYYCTQNFSYNGTALQAGRIYYVSYENSQLKFTDLGYDILTTTPTAPTGTPTGTPSAGEYVFDAGNPYISGNTPTASNTSSNQSLFSGYAYINNYTLYGVDNSGNTVKIASRIKSATASTRTLYSSISFTFTGTGKYSSSYADSAVSYHYYSDGSMYEYEYIYETRYPAEYSYSTSVTVNTYVYTGTITCVQNTGWWSTSTSTINASDYRYLYTSNATNTHYITSLDYLISENQPTTYSTSNTYWNYNTANGTTGWSQTITPILTGIVNLNNTSEFNSLTERMQDAVSQYVYQYTGTSGNGNFINNQRNQFTFYFTNGSYYRLRIGATGFYWETATVNIPGTVNGYPYPATGERSMSALLAAAQALRNNPLQIKYYGNYYYYNGPTVSTPDGSFVNGRIYRLLINGNGDFYFADTGKTCTVATGRDSLLGGLIDFNSGNIGDVYFLNSSGVVDTYQGYSFYEVSFNSDTGSYFMKKLADISPSLTESDSIYRLLNERIYITSTSNNYGGTGGTEKVILSAAVTVDGTEYIRLFDVSVIG